MSASPQAVAEQANRTDIARGEQFGQVLDRDSKRVDSTEQVAVFSPSWPVSVSASTTGESGGMYQTIGMVRYSGCSGSATW